MLLGRGGECGRIDGLLEEARRGRSGALLVRGEPGIGKSALLRYAVEQADGMSVLHARGLESESELPFSGLAELVRPVLDRVERIPPPQAAALKGALALAPTAPGDRFAVAAATLSLIATAAEHAPVLAAVDDAHWLDASSAEALLFAARRLGAEGIALLFAVRDEVPSAFDAAGLPELEVAGLDEQAVHELLARGSRPISSYVRRRLFEETRGNPLALLEIPTLLTDAQLAGREPLAEPLPAGATVERAFLRRIEHLSAEAQEVILVAAASDSGEMEEIAAAAELLGLDVTALDAAESAGLVTIDSRLDWHHPLLRSAVYHRASAARRRAVNRALADALTGGKRAWHLAAAVLAPDESVAGELEQAALEARRRSAYAAAAAAFERAASLTPDDEKRARRLVEAAHDLGVVGRSQQALELLDEALSRAADPRLRADIHHLRGRIQMWAGGPSEAYELLVAEAARIENLDPAHAAAMLTDAALTRTMTGDIQATLATARRARELAQRTGVTDGASALLGNALILAGHASEGYEHLQRARAAFAEAGPLAGAHFVQAAGHGSIWIEDYDEARSVLNRVVSAAREASAGGLLSFPLSCLSELDFRTGRWAAAYAGAAEADDLAEEAGQANSASFSLVCLARVEAAQGREAECRTHVERALALVAATGADSIRTYAGSAVGLLELGLGRPDAAIVHLETVARLVEKHGIGEPGVVWWAPDLVEAYVRAGRRRDAEDALAIFEGQAQATGRAWALAASARCRGLLVDEGSFEQEFADGLRWHGRTPTPFERARTELCLGERLRRAKRPTEARAPLRAALETFERLGAAPWAEQARAELSAAGERREQVVTQGLRELTGQELQIALLVAEGATNREAAAALFLSPKTIEFHLAKVYRKLGIRSRTELARLVAQESGPASPSAAEPSSQRAYV